MGPRVAVGRRVDGARREGERGDDEGTEAHGARLSHGADAIAGSVVRDAFGSVAAMDLSALRARLTDTLAATGVVLAVWTLSAPELVAGIGVPTSHEFGVRSDLFDMAIPLARAVAESVWRGALPSWFDGGHLGLALANVPEAMAAYPPTLLAFVLCTPVRAAAWLLLGHALLAGAATAALTGDRGASRPAQAMAATAVGAGLWLAGHARQVNTFCTAAWAPVVWWALARCLDAPSRRRAAVLALSAGFLVLAGHPQMAHHTALVLALWTLARMAVDPRGRTALRAQAASLVAAAVGAAGLAAAALAGTLEGLALAERATSLQGSARFAPRASMLVSLIDPSLAGSPLAPRAQGVAWWENTVYIGLPALLLAAVGVRRAVHDRALRPWALALVGALWLSYGRHGLFAAVHGAIPGMAFARFEQRHLWLATIALAVLAADGLDALGAYLRRVADARRARVIPWLAVGIQGLALTAALRANCPVQAPGALMERPASADMLHAAGIDAWAPGRCVLSFEPMTLHAFVVEQVGFGDGDLTAMVEARRLLIPQHARLWGWRSAGGYVGLVPRHLREGLGDMHDDGVLTRARTALDVARTPAAADHYADVAAWLGCDAVLSPFALPTARLTTLGVVPGRFVPTWIGRVASPMASARVVRGERWFPTTVRAAEAVSAGAVDLRASVIRVGCGQDRDGGEAGEAGWREGDDPAAVEVDVRATDAGTLVLTHGYHPRWQVSVDGSPWHAAERVDLVKLGVRVPAGVHRVRFRFDETPTRRAYALSAMALVALLALASVRPRR